MPIKRFIFTLFGLLLSTSCQLQPVTSETTTHFAGLQFQLPAQPVVIALAKDQSDFLLFKYSHTKGKDYLAFTQESRIDESCTSEQFFHAVLNPAQSTLCDSHAIAVFTQQFANFYSAEHWQYSGRSAYYLQTDDKRRFVFIPLSADQLLKIDTDYLSKQQLRILLKPYFSGAQ